MPELTTKLKLPMPLGNENVSRAAYRDLVTAVENGAQAAIVAAAAAPENPYDDMLWVDTSTTPYQLKQYNLETTSWKLVGSDTSNLATKTELSTHLAETAPHGAVSTATAGRLIVRDANGRAKVAAPSAGDDIARKDTVDAVQTNLNNLGITAGEKNIDGVDLNTITSFGFYWGTGFINVPSGFGGYGRLKVTSIGGANYARQTLQGLDAVGSVYEWHRVNSGGTWGPWVGTIVTTVAPSAWLGDGGVQLVY